MRAFDIEYGELILATGGRELFLPFPGWTLPNVTGAGGLQALVKQGLKVSGKRVVVAGSGPLLLAVAAFLRAKGATVAAVVEQASPARLARFGLHLFRHPAKLAQAVALAPTLYMPGSWVVAAEGGDCVERAIIHTPRGTRTIACEYLAVGFGLWPNAELARHLGCAVIDNAVAVDEFQRTSVAGIYCAGEAAGIGGLDPAITAGEVAGHAAGGREDLARRRFEARAAGRRFADALKEAFALRPELRDLPRPETIVCRCEDVRLAAIQDRDSWRAAKLHLRCGMGPCQGRVCGPAAQWLFGWTVESVRPPIFPARVASLISEHEHALGGSDAGHNHRIPRGSDGGL